MGGSDVLRAQWAASCSTLRRRLAGLTEAEFFWEPCDGCWSVRRSPAVPGGWIMDYPDQVPDPPPVTTIAWRLLHITHGNWIYWEHAFGPASRTYLDLETCHTADSAVADLVASQRPITDVLDAMADDALDRPVGTPFGANWPASQVLQTLLNEQVHHGAEIGLLRDLHLRLG
jgi:hypothetical protein